MRPAQLAGAASGLDFIHAQGLVHGDIKPSNILVSGKCVPMIGDFGLSHAQEEATAPVLHGAGTLRFMGPELFDDNRKSPPSDCWAYGMTMYQV